MPKLKINWKDIEAKAEALILDAAAEALPGEDKAAKVLDEIVRWLDEQLRFGPGPVGLIAEALDGPVLRAVLGAFVQSVYEGMRQAGRV